VQRVRAEPPTSQDDESGSSRCPNADESWKFSGEK
jgi:hypothetical protein